MKCFKCDGSGIIKTKYHPWFHYYKHGLTLISSSVSPNPEEDVKCDVCDGTGELMSYEEWEGLK